MFGTRNFFVNKVLIMGSSGMLGHIVCKYLEKNSNFKLINLSGTRKLNKETILIDVRNEQKIINFINKVEPDYVVNCIGSLVHESNTNLENAVFINSYLPLLLARVTNEIDSKLIHISTDCVFSGKKNTPYTENDFKDGSDFYGITKALGEPIAANTLTLRTSIIGPEIKRDGSGLFHWFMNQNGSVNGFEKMLWSGVTTLELAKAVLWFINNFYCGLYHVTNNQIISKNDLLSLIKIHTKKDIEIIPVNGKEVDKSFVDTKQYIDYKIPSYNEMVEEMVADITTKKNEYKYYNL